MGVRRGLTRHERYDPPSRHVAGSGGASYNASLAGIDQTDDGRADNYLARNIQGDLPATYRSPWIEGAGGA